MRCHPLSRSNVKCCTCDNLHRCGIFKAITKKQHKEYIEFILEQIDKYPEKYQLGVIMAEVKKPVNNILILNEDGSFHAQMRQEEIKALSDQEKLDLKDKIILGLNKAFSIFYKIEIKAGPVPDDIMRKKPTKKKKA